MNYKILLYETIYYSEKIKEYIKTIIQNLLEKKKKFTIYVNGTIILVEVKEIEDGSNAQVESTLSKNNNVLNTKLILNKDIFSEININNLYYLINVLIHEYSHIIFHTLNKYNKPSIISLYQNFPIRRILYLLKNYKNEYIKYLNNYISKNMETDITEKTAWAHTLVLEMVTLYKSKDEFIKDINVMIDAYTDLIQKNEKYKLSKFLEKNPIIFHETYNFYLLSLFFLITQRKKELVRIIKYIYSNFNRAKGDI